VSLKPGVLGSPCSRRHRLCVAMILKRQPPRTTPTCQHPYQHPVNTLSTPLSAHHQISRNEVLRIATCPSGSTNNAYPIQPQKYLVFALKKLAADCQEKTKKLAAPVINTGLRPVYCPATSSFTQHTPTTTNDNTFLVHMPFYNYPPSSPFTQHTPTLSQQPTTTLQHLPRTHAFALPFVAFLPLLSGKAVLLTY